MTTSDSDSGQGSSNPCLPLPPHVLIFPFPAQGHLNSMLNLAHLLCLSRLHVTFIVSEFSHHRLLRDSAVPSVFASYPGFQFQAVPDGIPDHHPRTVLGVTNVITAVDDTMAPLFKKKFIEEQFFASAGRRRPVSCIIADGILNFAADFAAEMGIPLVSFRTPGAAYFWTFFRLPELIEAGETPFPGDAMDELVKGLPGMEGILRRRDLASFFRSGNTNDRDLQFLGRCTRKTAAAQAAIFNTFEDLEQPMIAEIRKHIPRAFTIGPIHAHLKSRLTENNIPPSILSGGFWSEDQSCINWLNTQAPKSVIYVSFGSITVMTRQQLLEVWHGLVNSQQRFLWVMRPDSISEEGNENELPGDLSQGTKERGYIIEWAPQEEVLNHPAVGAFFTHSGWNSTMESVVAGVPMICWPYFADQMTNSRLVSEFWKIGLDIKDTCDRLIVENATREVMEVRKDEFQKRADELAQVARKAVSNGGSSYSNFDAFVHYIHSLII